MRLLSAFFRAVASSWLGIMSGIGGIVFTALSFYVTGGTQKAAFAAISLLSLLVAFFQAWKREHLAAGKREVTFEVDFWKSRVLLVQSDAQKAKDYFTGKHIELSLRIRFINGDVHPVLIRKVNAQLMQRKRFGRAMPVDEFVKPLQTEITELLEQKGLSVSEQSLSDYYLFRWSLRMPVADDGTIVLSMLRWFVRIEMYALKYPPLQIDFAIHWSNGEGTMLTKIE